MRKFVSWRRGAVMLLGAFLSVAAVAASVTYEYDEVGRLKAVVFADGTRVDYSLDGPGNRKNVNTVVVGPGSLQFAAGAYPATEGGAAVTVPVTRTGGNAGLVTAVYSIDISSTATNSADYSVSGTLSWNPGDSNPKNLLLSIVDDALVEGAETVVLRLDSTTGGATIGAPSTTTVTIAASDMTAPGAPTFSAILGNSATASWTAASAGAGVASYEYRLNGAASWTNVGNVLSVGLTGLTSATLYTFEVRARYTGWRNRPREFRQFYDSQQYRANRTDQFGCNGCISDNDQFVMDAFDGHRLGSTVYMIERCAGSGCSGFVQVGTQVGARQPRLLRTVVSPVALPMSIACGLAMRRTI